MSWLCRRQITCARQPTRQRGRGCRRAGNPSKIWSPACLHRAGQFWPNPGSRPQSRHRRARKRPYKVCRPAHGHVQCAPAPFCRYGKGAKTHPGWPSPDDHRGRNLPRKRCRYIPGRHRRTGDCHGKRAAPPDADRWREIAHRATRQAGGSAPPARKAYLLCAAPRWLAQKDKWRDLCRRTQNCRPRPRSPHPVKAQRHTRLPSCRRRSAGATLEAGDRTGHPRRARFCLPRRWPHNARRHRR